MNSTHIEKYIELRGDLTRKEWEGLNEFYNYFIQEKERELTKNLSLNDSEVNNFRSYAQRLIGMTNE